MSEPSGILDMSDPYDVHAFFVLSFWCSDCGAEVERDEGYEGCTDEDCKHISDKAKAAGWYVPPAEPPDGRMDVQTCFCPSCAQKRGL
jgi:hypothetical protein